MIGIAIYHSVQPGEHGDVLPALLAGAAQITGGPRLAYAGGTEAATGRSVREVQLSPQNLARLQADLRAGRLEVLELHAHKRAERERNVEGAGLELQLSADAWGDTDVACPYAAYVTVPDADVESPGALVAGARMLAETLASPYALIYAGPDFTDVYMEITATPVFPWDHVLTPDEERRKERLLAHQLARASLGRRVRGAYWGNFLGAEIVSALGGSDRVRAEAPAARVEPFARGLMLQLTDSPWDWTNPGYAERAAALDAFLEPVRVDGTD